MYVAPRIEETVLIHIVLNTSHMQRENYAQYFVEESFRLGYSLTDEYFISQKHYH